VIKIIAMKLAAPTCLDLALTNARITYASKPA